MSDPLPTMSELDLKRLASAWRGVDPCLNYQDAVRDVLEVGGTALAAMFGAPLEFGTAGLRGRLGPGPGAMNRVLVRVVARALGAQIQSQREPTNGKGLVVIGYDARHQSDEFAVDTARVLASMGMRATVIDTPAPTPVLAFAVRDLQADAGVMVTASHNPREDNGYKIYGSDGALMSSPSDSALSRRIRATPLVREDELVSEDHENIVNVREDVIERYVDQIASLLTCDGARSSCVAYTPLHGVGYAVFARAFERAGFPAPVPVPEQQEPDGDFPTTAFPNPEEPGVLRSLFETANEAGADLAMANDPDADRLAVAVPSQGSWRLLSGDELGCLIAEHRLASITSSATAKLVANTVVSSRLLGRIADHHGARYEQTLTGFKWLMQAQARHNDADFVMAYEEALGYAIGGVVRDKDGISAALVVAEIASDLAARGRTLLDSLDDLHLKHGVHASGQRAVRFEVGGPTSGEIMQWLRTNPPTHLDSQRITHIEDLALDTGRLPATDAIVLHLPNARLTIRPSGTEPKVKLYGECWQPPPATAADVVSDRIKTNKQLHALLAALSTHVCDPERAATGIKVNTTTPTDRAAVEERALALFANRPAKISYERALRLIVESIDLTTLAGDDTPGRVRALCAQARRPDPTDPTAGPAAAVCIYPNLVSLAAELTQGSGVAVASVAGAFPSGLSSLEVRLSDIAEAVCAGADEIDVVLNRAALLAGREDIVVDELQAMRQQIGPRVMKVILETSELETPAMIRRASRLAMHAGADWIKTSTGKSGAGATPLGVLVMAEAILDYANDHARPVGLKISGGVRTSSDALGYLSIIEAILGSEWLRPCRVRFGASGLLAAVVTDLSNERA